MSFQPFTPEQTEAAKEWLEAMDTDPVLRQAVPVKIASIFDLRHDSTGTLSAKVFDRGVFNVRFDWDGIEWTATCTCPAQERCRHAHGAMSKALNRSNRYLAAGTPPVVLQRTGPAQTFGDEVTGRLGRRLTADELRVMHRVEEVFKQWRDKPAVPATVLLAISPGGLFVETAEAMVSPWPEPPGTLWQTWLYIAAYLRRESRPLPPVLEQITDWAEVDAQLGEWDRQQSVVRWQQWLENAEKVESTASEPPIELRVALTSLGAQLEWRRNAGAEFRELPLVQFQQLLSKSNNGELPFDDRSLLFWHAFNTGYGALPVRQYNDRDGVRILNRILRDPASDGKVIGPGGKVLQRAAEPLSWSAEVAEGEQIDYHLGLVRADGTDPGPALVVLDGEPPLYVTSEAIFECPPVAGLNVRTGKLTIPAEALESGPGVTLLEKIRVEPPARVASRVRTIRSRPVFECSLLETEIGDSEHLVLKVFAESDAGVRESVYVREGWQKTPDATSEQSDVIYRHDRRALTPVPELLASLKVSWWPHGEHWHKPVGKKFADQFATWISSLPSDVSLSLDPALASLREPAIAARLRLDVQESGIDWFDVRIALDIPDTTLTKAELKALLDARGGFVRLGAKGWRRLSFQLSEEDESQLADLGLTTSDLSGESQRLHALQLAGKAGAKRLLSEEHTAAIERRAEEIRTRVSPDVPGCIKAALRPYQVEGFHFLAYLSSNRFGGILADDMGLGKTLQTLTWLMWLRESNDRQPSLVVCPKSVTDNWRAEAAHFAPSLRVRVLPRGAKGATLEAARKEADLIVVNYAQLRSLEKELVSAPWQAAILDEAQAIKNPESQTAKAAWKLNAAHRLALSGTPIENRLLDLWSIMQFAMPGVLGPRASFSKTFDQRTDPFARRRLSARVRPFVLRRTKNEVAKDLPDRIEEDIHCEMEGPQATLYRAELKRARAALLQLKTQAQLDKMRFNILTSLLRLRQICCHPALVSEKTAKAESAKLSALIDLLEPLVAEGHKVLVFSQFVDMLSLIQKELTERDWRNFLLTGETEDRGSMVREFQQSEGSAVFLISLRAGGFGLNLTAASYVVLFDPWWNPAVENQAIDRTHRIGQKNTVIAYRLLVKESIEEKIRSLQMHKRALATDVLGEENFARALTLEDFQFLLGE